MGTTLGLIDYGMGNLHSVQTAFSQFNKELKRIKVPTDLKDCDALVLPGVGSFDPAMEHLEQTDLIPHIKSWVLKEKPLLGICLGLQLLFEASEEGNYQGLGLLKGCIEKLPSNQGERIPHMGWAPIEMKKTCPLLLSNKHAQWMYFVHSYAANPLDKDDLAATANFGKSNITAIVWKGRLGACQFHPEKSSKAGSQMIKRWLVWLESGAKIIS